MVEDKLELLGAFKFPSKIKFTKNLKLSDLIEGLNSLHKDAYPFFGIIERQKTDSGTLEYITFNPSSILLRSEDKKLYQGDKIIVFKNEQIKQVQNYVLQKEQSNTRSSLKVISKVMFQKILIIFL